MNRRLLVSEWTAEDEKIVTLARSARARIGASSGAALRDTQGRTYASANVNVPPLSLTAIQLVVGQAIASGADGIEAVVLCDSVSISNDDLAVIRGFAGSGVPIFHVDLAGAVRETHHS